ncbi:Zinc transporter ZIP9 [Aphelenchoides bicaudatus]|nr:Zinc transporter ZIP9 [Aphelenchoides bicaudatus]
MVEGFGFFALLCLSMFIASYFIGYLPLLLGNLGQNKIRLVSIFGAGLLIGTAFSVVVPEGIDALHGSVSKAAHAKLGDPLELAIAKEAGNTKDKEGDLKRPLPDGLKETHPELDHQQQHSHDGEHEETGRTIGVLILSGFLFMLIIDQVSKGSLVGGRSPRKLSTTIGLCVHALADGVLLGSASSTKNSEVQMVVFFALVIHKGPSAFALSSLLLLENLERFRIKRHLFIFSLSAPFGALTTYFLLAAVKDGSSYSTHLSGVFMLFSAGTFVFVAAAHVLPELEQSNNGYDACSQIPNQLPSHCSSSGLALKEVLILIFGAVAPAFLLTHHHH